MAIREELINKRRTWHRPVVATIVIGIFVIAFVVRGLWFNRANSQAFDEAVYITSGFSYLDRFDFRLNREHPPIAKLLAALPVYLFTSIRFDPDPIAWNKADQYPIAFNFLNRSTIPADYILSLSRLSGIVLGAILVSLIGLWSYRLWGIHSAILGAGLAAFDPNLIAHSAVVGNDLPLTVFFFLTFYILWENQTRRSARLYAIAGIAAGLALATKFSALILVPIFSVIVVAHVYKGGLLASRWTEPVSTKGSITSRLMSVLVSAYVFWVSAVVVVALSYIGTDPSTWLEGIRWQSRHYSAGHDAFLYGEISRTGWWYYFLVAFLLKTPLGTVFLIVLGLLPFRRGVCLRVGDLWFLAAPAAIFFAVISYMRVDLGIRYILPVYAFLFVIASRAAMCCRRLQLARIILTGTLLALTAFSSLNSAPHDLSYFNEIGGGPVSGIQCLGGSNLDWGQDLRGLKAYMQREGLVMIYLSYFGTDSPNAHGIKKQDLPAPWGADAPSALLPENGMREVVAISVNNLQGIHLPNPLMYRWLLKRKPIAQIGYSIYVYDIKNDSSAHVELARIYVGRNAFAAAAREYKKAFTIDPTNNEARRMIDELVDKGTASY